MGASRALAAILVLLAAGPARAQPCQPQQAEARRALIERQLAADAGPSRLWNTGWGIGLGASAALTGVFAIEPDWAPIEVDQKLRASLAVSAAKATIGSAARWVLPLRVGTVPPPTGDACADLAAAEAALAWTASKQKRTFWLGILGGAALHIQGGLVLGLVFDAWQEAAIGVGLGALITTVMSLTQPRGAWRLKRRGVATTPEARSWLLAPEVAPGRVGLSLVISM